MGTFPYEGGWIDSGDIVVTDQVSHSPSKSLQFVGYCMGSAFADREFATEAEVIGFEGYVWVDSYGSTPDCGDRTTAGIMFVNRWIDTWGRLYAAIRFVSDGRIYAVAADGWHDLQEFSLHEWYEVRVLISKATDRFDVWINDQLKASNLLIEVGHATEILALSLGSGHASATVYFDDVKVFATVPQVDLTVGALYFVWWGVACNPHWIDGHKYNPILSEYDSSNPSVADQHISWAKAHGFDYFAVAWYGSHDWRDFSFIDASLRNGLLSSSRLSDIKFAIFYDSPAIMSTAETMGVDQAQTFIEDMIYIATDYFSLASYLRIQDKAVVFLGAVWYLYEKFGYSIQPIETVRQQLAQMGMGVYFVGDSAVPSEPDVESPMIRAMDAVTCSATLFTDSLIGDWQRIVDDMRDYFPRWLSAMKSIGIGFIPEVCPEFDDTAYIYAYVLYEDGFYKIWYAGNNVTTINNEEWWISGIGYAVSPPPPVGLLNFDDYRNRMGSITPMQPSTTFYFPHFHQDSNWQTYISVVNPSSTDPTEVTFTAYRNDGTCVDTAWYYLGPGVKVSGFVYQIIPGATGTGWIEVHSDLPIVGILNFDDYANRMGSIVAVIPIESPVFPHFHQDASWETYYAIVNIGPSATFTSTYCRADGLTITSDSATLAINSKIGRFATGGTGWLRITSPP